MRSTKDVPKQWDRRRRTFFAWLPVELIDTTGATIKLERRWLETVTIEEVHHIGAMGPGWWKPERFIEVNTDAT